MWCAQVAFWFPFQLTLPAGGYPISHEGRRAMLDVESSSRCWRTTVVVPAADRPPDARRNTYEVRAGVRGLEIPVRKAIVSSARKFLEEVEEDVGFAFLTVSFEKEGDCPEATALDANALVLLIDEALDFVRCFASVYRLVSWQTDVFLPTQPDSPAVRIEIARNYTFSDGSLTGEFTTVSQNLRMPADPRSGSGKPPLSEAQITDLDHRLRTGKKLHISEELRLEAWELGAMHRNFRLALVVANTAFETWLQWRVLKEFRLRSVTHYPPNEPDALVNVIPQENVMPLFKVYIAYLAGRDVRTEAVYAQWRTDAYLPRNEVVHRGRMNVTDAESRNALQAIAALSAFLEAELTKTRPRATP